MVKNNSDPQATAGASVVEPATGGLGTFAGVFTPSILTILGVIMYLRFGWVVGNVGLKGTLVIVTIATLITFLTGLSISEIATDRVVRVGGAYYMISRSLGIETGGAVGIPLYFAQTLSVALYTIGFAESVSLTFQGLDQKLVALITTLLVAFLAIKSAQLAIKAQYFIMAAIIISLLSFALGKPLDGIEIDMWAVPAQPEEGFWGVFAVFFPAVTGITAGVNLSGDLKNPSRSIPIGTMAAIAAGYAVYMILPFFMAWRADPQSLIEDRLIMRQLSFWGDAILLGVWGATLSSAIGSILGAPRVLQALARDGVLPRQLKFLGAGSGADDEPRVGTVVTLAIALIAVAVGDLNLIAPVLTMFFLTTYLVLNVAAGIETFLRSPSFRPTFWVHWAWSLLGAIGCLAVMFLINAVATTVAAVIVAGIFLWLEQRELESAWGDVRRGIWMALIRAGILRLDYKPDAKNWRPNILVFSGSPTKRWHLIELAAIITHNRGLITVASVLPCDFGNPARQTQMEVTVRDYLSKHGIQSLVRIVTADDPYAGAEQLVQAYGLGPLIPNTVILGDNENAESRDRYCQFIANLYQSDRNVVIFREIDKLKRVQHRRIDVWWGGLQGNGGLMLLLAHLLQTSVLWRRAEINLRLVAPTESAAQSAHNNLENLMQELRIRAIPQIIVAADRPFKEILGNSSQDADLVFLGIARPDQVEDYAKYYQNLQSMAGTLSTTVVLVLASPSFTYTDVL
ncbi:amino acid permease-associated region [Thalassoporum mexicanum PCC 7367]|uniref:amino acid permease n=1 Tax=Thalassoporum mexicanum TaxID=3457544 RepID=UPI00029F84BA|nr:amino acid permease [Pseudanabaena sp. PCC 7367]AFY69866.1 amino acid permease-associated region [Pseudanabaena sp. PCC 7367]